MILVSEVVYEISRCARNDTVLGLFADSSKLIEKIADVNQHFLKYVPIVFKRRHFMKLNLFLQCIIQGGFNRNYTHVIDAVNERKLNSRTALIWH